MLVGGALGEMLVPALIAAILGSDDGGLPGALYSICVASSVLMMVVYGVFCSQLNLFTTGKPFLRDNCP